ncbi:peptidoglycan editing factor PgeF [Metabacillus sp. FJAT-52054]|uniref:Purine nucleoside phosphorylase n=1 Tax=Metabacillus sediminis TaxID=3117746 RepID=A0ABZ2NN38_9BACI
MMEPFIKDRETFLSLDGFTTINSSIIAGFTVKNGGVSTSHFSTLNMGLHVNDDPADVVANRKICALETSIPLRNWVFADQVHGSRIVKAEKENRGDGAFEYEAAIHAADGIYTDKADTMLALAFADCVPIFFYEEAANLIGVAHAGWKGSVLNIGQAMISRWIEAEGAQLDRIHAVIGPSIGSCCYKVDDRVIEEVNKHFDPVEEVPYKEAGAGQYFLDLKALNEALLVKAGLNRENISVSGRCTSCEDQLFFSHRRDNGKTGRMIGFIGLKEEGS